MTPGARVQAAIEILDLIVASAQKGGAAADTIISRYFQTRRYAGSKDRRAVRDLVFRAVRRCGECPESGRAAMLGLAADDPGLLMLFDGAPYAPGAVSPAESVAGPSVVPSWLIDRFDPLVGEEEWPALLERAPLDLRVNVLKGNMDEARAALPEAEPMSHSPIGLRLPEGWPAEKSEAWLSGMVEVQGEASQLVNLACGAEPGMTVIDLCAGAGGKTLAIAAQMHDRGRIIACDTDRTRLSRIAPRAERAGVSIIEPRLLDPGRETEALGEVVGTADIVLVDAPCSGSGTWRRNPETRWRLTPERLARLTILQARLLDLAASLVRPGGVIVYAVCSLLVEEGRDQADAFPGRHSSLVPDSPFMHVGREAGAGRLLTPAHDGTDGFFVARWHMK